MSVARMGVLHPEHVLLGAEFRPSATGDVLGVESYSLEGADEPPTLLCDLTGATYLLASGGDAATFAEAVLAGRRLAVGQAAFEGVLNGAGALVGAPLVARTGDEEYVIVDASAQAGPIAAWLGLLAGSRSPEGNAFPDLSLETADDMLVPLLLCGPEAQRVLADYLHGADALPVPGTVAQLRLDAIGCLVTRLAAPMLPPALLVMVPPASSRILWRSLLSFTEVTPVGHGRVRRLLADSTPWGRRLADSAPAGIARGELMDWGVCRDGADFVGARALG